MPRALPIIFALRSRIASITAKIRQTTRALGSTIVISANSSIVR